MKKFILTLLMILTVGTMFSQKVYYTDYVSKIVKIDSCWSEWSDWEQCFTEIEITSDNINIYDIQSYKITKNLGTEETIIGKITKFNVVDNGNKSAQIRILIKDNGTKQLYIDYSEIIYVYNLN